MQLPLLAPPRASAVQGQACFMAAVDAHIYLSTTYRATEQQVTLWGSLFKSRLSSGETFYPGQVRAELGGEWWRSWASSSCRPSTGSPSHSSSGSFAGE